MLDFPALLALLAVPLVGGGLGRLIAGGLVKHYSNAMPRDLPVYVLGPNGPEARGPMRTQPDAPEVKVILPIDGISGTSNVMPRDVSVSDPGGLEPPAGRPTRRLTFARIMRMAGIGVPSSAVKRQDLKRIAELIVEARNLGEPVLAKRLHSVQHLSKADLTVTLEQLKTAIDEELGRHGR